MGERQTEDLKVPGSIPGLGKVINGACLDVANVCKHILDIMAPHILGPGFQYLLHSYTNGQFVFITLRITPRPGIEPGSSA